MKKAYVVHAIVYRIGVKEFRPQCGSWYGYDSTDNPKEVTCKNCRRVLEARRIQKRNARGKQDGKRKQ